MKPLRSLILLVLALALALSCLSLLSFANDVKNSEEYSFDIYGHWDSIKADGEHITQDGGAVQYIISTGGNVSVHATTLTVRGWIASNYGIVQFGYVIDDGEPVLSDSFTVEAEQPVYDAAAEAGMDYAARYEITFETAGLPAEFRVRYVVKIDNGDVVEISAPNLDGVEFYYSDPDAVQTEEPTATPEGGTSAAENKSISELRFNSYEKVEDFFMYSTNNVHVGMIDYDEEKNACIISVMGGPDPNVVMPFGQIALDSDVPYFEGISADTCKAAVIIASFDYGNVFNSDTQVEGTFYYQSDGGSTYSENKNLHYKYENTDGLQYVVLNFERARTWSGDIQDCRFDMFCDTDNDTDYYLYYFGFFASVSDANEFIELYKQKGDEALKAEPETPTPVPATDTPEPAPTDAPATEAPVEPTEAPATEKPSGKKGCGNMIGGSAFAIVAVLSAACVFAKKKNQ